MKRIYILALSLSALGVVSCGDKKAPAEESVENINVEEQTVVNNDTTIEEVTSDSIPQAPDGAPNPEAAVDAATQAANVNESKVNAAQSAAIPSPVVNPVNDADVTRALQAADEAMRAADKVRNEKGNYALPTPPPSVKAQSDTVVKAAVKATVDTLKGKK